MNTVELSQERQIAALEALNISQADYKEAQADYKKAKAEYDHAKEVFSADYKIKNPNASEAEILRYLREELKDFLAAVESCRRTYEKLVEIYNELVKKKDSTTSNQVLSSLQKLETNQLKLSEHLIPFIEELKLERFELVAPSYQSNNQAVKVNCINFYNGTTHDDLPSTITCQFLGIDFPTNQVTCAHIFQKKWAKSRKIIDLQEINDVRNLLLLFKPIEVAFDEGRICFLWDNEDNQFKMRVLDPSIRSKTLLHLAQQRLHNFPATGIDPIFSSTIDRLEGRPLTTGNHIPYKRCLAFHASRARYEAIHIKKWINAEDFIIPDDAWSPNILETPELKSQILLWLNQD